MISALKACILIASTLPGNKVIETDTLRIEGLRQPVAIYKCQSLTMPPNSEISVARPLREIKSISP